MAYEIRTTRAQGLIEEAHILADRTNGYLSNEIMEIEGNSFPVIDVLERASNLLRIAAEELAEQRLLCHGFPSA